MLELILTLAMSLFDLLSQIALDCWSDWIGDPRPYRFCYAGLFALYLAGYFGAGHRHLYGLGAALYLALYLA